MEIGGAGIMPGQKTRLFLLLGRLIGTILLPVTVALLGAFAFYLGLTNYELFHVLAELFIFGVAASVFVVAWNSRRFTNNSYFLILGIGSLFISVFHVLHMLVHNHLVQLPQGSNLSMQLWLVTRFLLAATFVVAPLLVERKVKVWGIFGTYGLIVSVFGLLFYCNLFPDCCLNEHGSSPFGTAAEIVIVTLLVVSLGILHWKRRRFTPDFYRMVFLAVFAALAGEVTFIPHGDEHGVMNVLGHVLMILSFYLLYRALVRTSLCQPYAILFQDLQESERRYRETAEELARSNAELEQFASVASHDLQEPLRMVSSYLQLIERRYKDRLDGEGLEFIRFAVDGATRMQTLIVNLLKYARAGSKELKLAPVCCDEAVKRALHNLSGRIAEANASVKCEKLPMVLGDECQLTQLFQNLVGNAIKFRSPERAPAVRISAIEKERTWVFSVQDNGVGIDRAYWEMAFNIFQRIPGPERRAGSGIGLATCKKIVERHGGRIWIESKLGQGSTFFFSLPAQ